MKSVVMYASHFGNTRKIAEAIASSLRTKGSVQLFSVDDAPACLPAGTDLVVIGGPTEQHGMTEPLIRFFARLESGALAGIHAAAFDTRLRWPRWLSGSAAGAIEARLREMDARLVAPAQSFFIKGIAGTGGRNTAALDADEVERAQAWATALAESLLASVPATPRQAI